MEGIVQQIGKELVNEKVGRGKYLSLSAQNEGQNLEVAYKDNLGVQVQSVVAVQH